MPGVAIALGLLLASLQLFPTWSLKQNSQRETSSSVDFDPGYGHIPPRYLTQLITPWSWYADPSVLNGRLNQRTALSYPADTNPVEAHLYVGLIPCLLAMVGVVIISRSDSKDDRRMRLLALLGFLAVVYATGLAAARLATYAGVWVFSW